MATDLWYVLPWSLVEQEGLRQRLLQLAFSGCYTPADLLEQRSKPSQYRSTY